MASIANRTGHSDTGANYSSIAHDYIHKWQTLGFALDASPPHATLSYGQNASWGLLYNLFMDRELGLGLVPQSVYDIQDTWYPTVFEKYGVVRCILPTRFFSLFTTLTHRGWLRARKSSSSVANNPSTQPLDTRHSYTKSKFNHRAPSNVFPTNITITRRLGTLRSSNLQPLPPRPLRLHHRDLARQHAHEFRFHGFV